MKRSNFAALLLGTVSAMLFALGMCMVLLPEWNAFQPGLVFGCIGLVLGGITFFVWRRTEGKAPIALSSRNLRAITVGLLGALLLGAGLCFCLVWSNLIVGILIGMTGIVVLLCLIPILIGFRD